VKYELRASQSFLIRRPVDGGTKPLRKHESVSCCRLPSHASGAPVSSFTVAGFENGIDYAGHFRGTGFVHQALTAIGKDCGYIGKKGISAHLAQPRPALIRISRAHQSRCSHLREAATGELAWL
jgi:hypothetical protein